ncbi:MAG: DUF885 family protein, partial [Paraglaciecola sp.]
MNRKPITVAVLLSLGLLGCGPSTSTKTEDLVPKVAAVKSESQKLNELVQSYFDESMQMNPIWATFVGINDYDDMFSPPINKANIAKVLAFEALYLDKIKAIDPSSLIGQDLLTYEIFLRDRELALKGANFPSELIPLHQMGGAHSYFASLGSGQSAQPFNTLQDFRNFIERAKGFAVYMDSAIVAMQEGIKKSVVLPKPIIEKVLPQLKAHVLEDVTQSVFYGPVANIQN